MVRKKTTIYMDDNLWRMAKVKAATQDKTLGDYLEELIKEDTRELSSDTTLLALLKTEKKNKKRVSKREKRRH